MERRDITVTQKQGRTIQKALLVTSRRFPQRHSSHSEYRVD